MERFCASPLKLKPKSKVLRAGYINTYSELNSQEERGLKYKLRYKEINHRWEESLVLLCKKFAEILQEKGGEIEKVLDAGCGHGNYILDEFRQKINWAVGVDLAPKFTVKNICLDEIKYSDLTRLPFTDNSFDMCLSLWTLEHLPNPKAALAEILRVLKPGGYFLLATPNRRSLLIWLRSLVSRGLAQRWLGWVYGRKESDVFSVYYRANETKLLKRLLEGVGFEETVIIPNYDPSYTSFGELTFWLSNLTDKVLSSLGFPLTKTHLVGWAKKP